MCKAFFITYIMKNIFFGSLLIILALNACKNNTGCENSVNLNVDQAQLAEDIANIDAYLNFEGIQAQEHPSGIRYTIQDPGNGDQPNLCSTVFVEYRGTLLNGAQFDASSNIVSLTLNRLIEGWKIGIPLIREGGNITLYIPSVYAYRSSSNISSIPPNSSLVFTISLYLVK